LALLPTVLFFSLDAYYLTLEKGFREAYNLFVEKVHLMQVTTKDLYSVSTEGDVNKHIRDALKSFSIWGFYLGVLILIIISRFIVLA
jgi:hypothetical protein